ncbi:MAG: hypothetical protein JKY94_10095, partial [Rhodobacteraceae bacterium]|nr:hypothetical protein [Paracoccaceae bacterium]
MGKVYNRAKMSITSVDGGTGELTLNAAEAGYQTFTASGAANNETLSYVIEDGDAWEYGEGIYTATGTKLTRVVTKSSDGAGTQLTLTGSAVVFMALRSEDFYITPETLTHTSGAISIDLAGG